MQRVPWGLIQDLQYAFRALWKNPAYTVIGVLTLLLGVGANTAMFSIINGVLLRPLPYPRPKQLVRLAHDVTRDALSLTEFEFWKKNSSSFSSLAGYRDLGERRLSPEEGETWITTMAITEDFFRSLGISPALGREFAGDETERGGSQAIIITDPFWRTSLGADTEVLGRTIKLNDASFVVVGVLPQSFWWPQAADAFIPLRRTGGIDDDGTNTAVIGRLKEGRSIEQANAEMARLTETFQHDYAGNIPREYHAPTVFSYQNWLVGNVRLSLWLLFGTTGLLFLMACSNFASLLLTRLAAREKEIAVRLALGSSNSRLLRQFLLENLMLSALGSLGGLIAANGLLASFIAVIPFQLPASGPIRLDRTVLFFAVSVCIATALLFTLLAIVSAARLNIHGALKSAGRVAESRNVRRYLRSGLVVTQVALSALLLTAATLLIESFYRLRQEQLGFVPHALVTFETPLASDRYHDAASASNFVDLLTTRLRAFPGVSDVAATNLLPLTGGNNLPAQREGHPEQSIGGMEIRVVTPAYFRVMGIPLLNGRPFSTTDTAASLPVTVVNETLARKWWPHNNAVGGRVVIGLYHGKQFPEIKDAPREVVGIAADTKTSTLKGAPAPTVFVPMVQASDVFVGMTGKIAWIVRAGNAGAVPEGLRRVVAEFDPGQRVLKLRSMDELVDSATASSRFDALLFGTFAAMALLLAAIGVYGLLSFLVAQRRQEIGTRMALGATRANVVKLVLKQSLVPTLVGSGLGLAGALLLMRFLSSLLYGVRANDPLSFVCVALLMFVVSTLASYVPSFRAARVEPTEALRYE